MKSIIFLLLACITSFTHSTALFCAGSWSTTTTLDMDIDCKRYLVCNAGNEWHYLSSNFEPAVKFHIAFTVNRDMKTLMGAASYTTTESTTIQTASNLFAEKVFLCKKQNNPLNTYTIFKAQVPSSSYWISGYKGKTGSQLYNQAWASYSDFNLFNCRALWTGVNRHRTSIINSGVSSATEVDKGLAYMIKIMKATATSLPPDYTGTLVLSKNEEVEVDDDEAMVMDYNQCSFKCVKNGVTSVVTIPFDSDLADFGVVPSGGVIDCYQLKVKQQSSLGDMTDILSAYRAQYCLGGTPKSYSGGYTIV